MNKFMFHYPLFIKNTYLCTLNLFKEMKNESTKIRLWNANYTRVWISNFLLYFSFMLLMPLFPLYLRDTFGADKEVIGWVLSGYTVAAMVVRPLSGFLVDSFPRRMVLIVCYSLVVAIFCGYLVAGSLFMFALFRTLHGAPFGATTVATTTMAIDVLHPERRAEGIGYFGLANNFATAISPTVAVMLLNYTQPVYDIQCAGCQLHFTNYTLLFILSIITSAIGLIITLHIQTDARPAVRTGRLLSLDRFLLLSAWCQSLCMVCYSFSYGVLSTYLAIYGEEELGIHGGTGLFFLLLAGGLALSRITGARGLRRGMVRRNAIEGILVSLCGYLLFAALHHPIGFYGAAVIIGLGNGHMYPAFQNMFVNIAPNSRRGTAMSTLLTSWDLGVGIGVLAGGIVAQWAGYHAAFWMMWAVNLAGAIGFFLL